MQVLETYRRIFAGQGRNTKKTDSPRRYETSRLKKKGMNASTRRRAEAVKSIAAKASGATLDAMEDALMTDLQTMAESSARVLGPRHPRVLSSVHMFNCWFISGS